MKRIHLSKRKTKGLLWGVCGLLLLSVAITALISCEDNSLEWLADDSSYEARIEEARMAIDDTEYQRAIELLTELKADYPGDPLVLQYLSNAYAGLSGLDTFNLLTVIDELTEGDEEGDIDMVGTVLGDPDGFVIVGDIDDILANLDEAISNLEDISNPTDDQKVQLGLLSLNRAVMTIAAMVAEEQGLADTDTVQVTDSGLGAIYGGTNPDLSAEWTPARDNSLNEDYQDIGDAVDSIGTITGEGEENELSDNFDEFQSNLDDDGNGSISQADIENYLGSL
jgi:hypothetical protein